jgi:hypothetical protein
MLLADSRGSAFGCLLAVTDNLGLVTQALQYLVCWETLNHQGRLKRYYNRLTMRAQDYALLHKATLVAGQILSLVIGHNGMKIATSPQSCRHSENLSQTD